jgi:hypothetical protein
MNEMRLEPPTSAPPPLPSEPAAPEPGNCSPEQGSLAAGMGLAWLVMVVGEFLILVSRGFGNLWAPPVIIVVWGALLLGSKPRTGKGMFLGLLSIVAVAVLLVAACFGLFALR